MISIRDNGEWWGRNGKLALRGEVDSFGSCNSNGACSSTPPTVVPARHLGAASLFLSITSHNILTSITSGIVEFVGKFLSVQGVLYSISTLRIHLYFFAQLLGNLLEACEYGNDCSCCTTNRLSGTTPEYERSYR